MWIPTVEASNLFSLAAASLLAAVHFAGSRDRVDAEFCDAASSGNVSRVKALLADGVSADSADEDGTTALMAATFAGEREIVELLLQAEADPNLQDEAGLTALMNAVIGDGEMNLEGAHSVFYDIIECRRPDIERRVAVLERRDIDRSAATIGRCVELHADTYRRRMVDGAGESDKTQTDILSDSREGRALTQRVGPGHRGDLRCFEAKLTVEADPTPVTTFDCPAI